MGHLTIRFRGVFSIALGESESGVRSARVLIPRAAAARCSFGNDQHLIPALVPYIGLPVQNVDDELILPSVMRGSGLVVPTFITPIDPQHRPPVNLKLPFTRRFNMEMIRMEEVLEIEDETEKPLYAIYALSNHEIQIPGAEGSGGVDFDDDDVPDVIDSLDPKLKATGGLPNRESINWIPRLENFEAAVRSEFVVGSNPPSECIAFADLPAGQLKPVMADPTQDEFIHARRFMYTDREFHREVADGMIFDAEVPAVMEPRESQSGAPPNGSGMLTMVMRSRRGARDVKISVPADSDLPVLIGNESLADIIGIGSRNSCGVPAYHFELHYMFCEEMERFPVPTCDTTADGRRHRTHPRPTCGPPAILPGVSPAG